jgi:hypothetical protein
MVPQFSRKDGYELRRMLETKLAMHCAPVLLGKKTAAIFTKPPWWDSVAPDSLNLSGIELNFASLERPTNKDLIFVYNSALLADTLKNPPVRREIHGMGYPVNNGISACLAHLKVRFRTLEVFPHEVGFFLGYPAEDVVGFICNKGANYKACGMWKVYSDVERAAVLFEEYRHCKRILLTSINRNNSILSGNIDGLEAV